ncbi:MULTISPECIES: ester cyclase [Mycobacteriaceae]|uniref:ester cyclase n=1 Tax=Mycobacteriaceae TaxID=1762 RepID=UPI000A06D9E7
MADIAIAKMLYKRWIDELWAGQPIASEVVSDDFVGHWPDRDVCGPAELHAIIKQTHDMIADLRFTIEIGPIVEGDLVAGRWVGVGKTDDGPMRFTGNDILRCADGRFVEYWTGTSTSKA